MERGFYVIIERANVELSRGDSFSKKSTSTRGGESFERNDSGAGLWGDPAWARRSSRRKERERDGPGRLLGPQWGVPGVVTPGSSARETVSSFDRRVSFRSNDGVLPPRSGDGLPFAFLLSRISYIFT